MVGKTEAGPEIEVSITCEKMDVNLIDENIFEVSNSQVLINDITKFSRCLKHYLLIHGTCCTNLVSLI